MRILQLHVDYIEYTPIKEEIVDAEPIVDKEKKRLENIVVILLSIEKGDENLETKDFLNETKKYLDTIKCNSVLLYPYAHLSSNLENPKKAMKFLNRIEEELRMNLSDSTFQIYRAPFGWTKQLEFRIKGHPMAENSKTFDKISNIGSHLENEKYGSLERGQDDHDHEHTGMSHALRAEKTLRSSWFILEPSG